MASERGKRKITMTGKAEQVFRDSIAKYEYKLLSWQRQINGLIAGAQLESMDNDELQSLASYIVKAYESYERVSAELCSFLKDSRSELGKVELSVQTKIAENVKSKCEKALIDIEAEINKAKSVKVVHETELVQDETHPASITDTHQDNGKDNVTENSKSVSNSMKSSVSSNASRISSVYLKQKAKLEAAKVRLKFVEKEAELQKSLQVLKSQRKLYEAEAELKAMDEVMGADSSSRHSSNSQATSDMEKEKRSRTMEYVQNQTKYVDANNETGEPTQSFKTQLNVQAPEFIPKHRPNELSDMTKFVLRKDLLMSTLTKFTDKPEEYCVWKMSFLNVVQELEIRPSEQLDLLSKWLGTDSRKQAVSLRAANIHNPTQALVKIWTRLDEKYGAPEQIESSLRDRLNQFPKLTYRDGPKLFELSNLLGEIVAIKENPAFSSVMAYFDSSSGINPIVRKLPAFIQNKWTDRAFKYKQEHHVIYPTFNVTVFEKFIQEISSRMNNPSFNYGDSCDGSTGTSKAQGKGQGRMTQSTTGNRNSHFLAKKTEINDRQLTGFSCPLHDKEVKHFLIDCHLFLSKSREDKKEILLKHGICFKCLKDKHLAKDCKEKIVCTICNGSSHCTIFHIDRVKTRQSYGEELSRNKGDNQDEQTHAKGSNQVVNSNCTQLCGGNGPFMGKSCAKTVLVNIWKEGQPDHVLRTYATIDEQSNRTLANSEFFDFFRDSYDKTVYSLSTCAGSNQVTGRQANGYIIQSMDKEHALQLPLVTECNHIPNAKQEIPTPEVAHQYHHMQDIADLIPEYEGETPILLLIGRDLISAHHVLDQRTGNENEPYAQKLKFGWVVIGESCLGLVHRPSVITAYKSVVLPDGRPTLMDPCPNYFKTQFDNSHEKVTIGNDIFQRTKVDDIPGYSQMDKEFMNMMDREFVKDESGNWSAPLPLKKERPTLSNNFEHAKHRAENLRKSLLSNPVKKEHFCTFMKGILDKKQAEVAPKLGDGEEAWYLPIFGVYHPQKPNKIRVVFDSAAKFDGHSLNDILMTGPDLTNNLVGVLLKFRKERIAITADVEQMFFNFHVHERDRNFLRFLWFQDNDPSKQLMEYRMCVHVFGNSSSPCIATLGLRKAVCSHTDQASCDEICSFVKTNFYVDDGLASVADEECAVQLLKDTQTRLQENGNIHLHKFASNSNEVLRQLSKEDVSYISDMDFEDVVHRSLGLLWKVSSDIFTFRVSDEIKPFTKRGLLSTIHSVFDPLGFAAPVILGGRLLLRGALSSKELDWDDPLPPDMNLDWEQWRTSLKDLEHLDVPRCYSNISLEKAIRRELHIFSDASKDAIGAVAYMELYDVQDNCCVGYVLGKSKVAPSHGHTIPRLELCAAVLATELGLFISENLNVDFDSTYYYTDSQVVLGYIFNDTRRFYVYVSNRISKILKLSSKEQWSYVSSENNPADCATRPMRAKNIGNSIWLSGPKDILNTSQISNKNVFPLVDADEDSEIEPIKTSNVLKTNFTDNSTLSVSRFSRFSSWSRLVKAIASLKRVVCRFNGTCLEKNALDFVNGSKTLILKSVQQNSYSKEINQLHNGLPLSKDSSLIKLSPFLDNEGLLRVGGRIQNSDIDLPGKNPIIIPAKQHVATLLVRHYHEKSEHQGRHITEGSIRSSGYWIVGGKHLISSVLHHCVVCRKLRGKFAEQKMSNLPQDRLSPCPPFTYIGLDVFGPWRVNSRRTRGGQANAKRWAVIFCCMVTRGIHIETIEDMSTSCFINALRRFVALRGPVKHIRSDKGSNFVGASKELNFTVIDVEDKCVKDFLLNEGITWTFNPPYASHMGGSWERLIGVVRRILDNMLRTTDSKHLTHEVLSTFFAETCAIVNQRPLVPVSDDPENTTVLSPNALITQKVDVDSMDPILESFAVKDMYRSQWRCVQVLAQRFWNVWRKDYLQSLQTRQKWNNVQSNLKVGDIVLLKDNESRRNDWPLGCIESVFPSQDGLVIKVKVKTIGKDKSVSYIRPITQVVLILSE